MLLDAKQVEKAESGKEKKWRRDEVYEHLLYPLIMSRFRQRSADLRGFSLFSRNRIQ